MYNYWKKKKTEKELAESPEVLAQKRKDAIMEKLMAKKKAEAEDEEDVFGMDVEFQDPKIIKRDKLADRYKKRVLTWMHEATEHRDVLKDFMSKGRGPQHPDHFSFRDGNKKKELGESYVSINKYIPEKQRVEEVAEKNRKTLITEPQEADRKYYYRSFDPDIYRPREKSKEVSGAPMRFGVGSQTEEERVNKAIQSQRTFPWGDYCEYEEESTAGPSQAWRSWKGGRISVKGWGGGKEFNKYVRSFTQGSNYTGAPPGALTRDRIKSKELAGDFVSQVPLNRKVPPSRESGRSMMTMSMSSWDGAIPNTGSPPSPLERSQHRMLSKRYFNGVKSLCYGYRSRPSTVGGIEAAAFHGHEGEQMEELDWMSARKLITMTSPSPVDQSAGGQ